jgi:hypothetical protein
MAGVETVELSTGGKTRIGLIVRGKLSPDHHPDKLDQHADCILADGTPLGFFGEANDNWGNAIGLRMQGAVYDYARLGIERPYYVDMDQANAARVVSTVLLVEVDEATAKLFAKAWDDMSRNPGDFNIIGGNCATHASAAFIQAKVLTAAIPWMDTPDNLYGQLVDSLPASKRTSITGYIGFERKPGGGFRMKVTPYVDDPSANRPNPGTSISGGSSKG